MSADGRDWTQATPLEAIGENAAAGIAHPGDILVFRYGGQISHEDAARIRSELLEQLPGLADVILVPVSLEVIYRQDEP